MRKQSLALGMETPRDENRALTRSRFVPTPKMSDRKKSLFATESRGLVRNAEEDSDLGPMSPLKFSNSPKRGALKVLNITSFRNILGNDSPDSDRSLSPDFERRFTHSDRYEILPATYDKENQIMDEETRLSFPNGTPRRQGQAESALLDETNSNSLSVLMSSDLNIVDKRNPILKTPGLSDAAGQKKEPRTSFRKMSFQGNTSTPSDGHKANSSFELSGESRARTSLSFSDIRPISTKSFYSSNASPDAIQKPVTKSTPTYSSFSYGRVPQRRATSNPRKRQPAKKRNNSIRLGNVFHKIKKPTAKRTKATTVKKLSTSQILESTASLFAKQPAPPQAKKPPVQSKSAPSSPQKPEPMKQQIERIKKILSSSRNPIEQARPLALSRSMVNLADGSLYESASEDEPGGSFEEANDSHGEDDDDDDEAKPEVGGRKFFKSSSSRRIKREYKVVNNVSATVRKGGQISLKPTKQKKRKYRSLFEEEFDFASEQLEVDDIISKLTGFQAEPDPVGTRQSTPRGTAVAETPLPVEPEPTTVQIEIIDALQSEISNDEPIAVQPNVIYVDRLSPLLNGAGSTTSEDSCSSSREIPFGEDSCMQTEYQESPTMQIRTMTSSLTITKSFNISDQFRDASESKSHSNQRLFPIFYKDHQRTLTQDACYSTLFDAIRRKPKRLRTASRGVGSNQYQIDAGQKAYGAQQCPECGLVYSVHEPEEELIHENYHSSLHVLRFAGWTSEVVAGHVPEWDVTGRVLVVGMTAGKHKLQKVQEVLAVVDRELGFVEPCRMVLGSVVYLAVARGTILGICVVQPLQHANRLLTIEGTEGSIDCCTIETYPAKCGISRIWVSPSFRGHGIARTLLTVMKSHFVFGYQMSYDEIAFSAPTEAGKRLAEAVTGRKDFLIYA